ncbi:MAG: DUF962 domain-containing protein [Burkholderiaceae bacterium]|nr:DUF962 domain-containing protein [Burkholderiaceae bacterium]
MTTTQRARYTPYKSFAEFYPYYLSEHRHPVCRRLHFFGSLGALFCLARLAVTMNPAWLVAALLWGYGLAWIGHFAFERNRPASFRQPLYSLLGDWAMFRDILTGRIAF